MSTAATPPALDAKGMGPALLGAVVVGILASFGAWVFITVVTKGQQWLWTDLPEHWDWTSLPFWYVLVLMLVGAGLIAAAHGLPGHTGNPAFNGLHFDVVPKEAPAILLAALGTLVFGFVLGPEAPLIVAGGALGRLALRRRGEKAAQLGMLLGGAAAIGLILGNPFVTAFMFLEFAAMGAMPGAALLPVSVALATGYLVQDGIGDWTGLPMTPLSVTGLPHVDGSSFGDLLVALGVAVVAALIGVVVRILAMPVLTASRRHRLPVLFGSAVAVAVLAAVFVAWRDAPVDLVLFSGQDGMSALIAQTSMWTVAIAIVIKALAYALALGGSFRGGPIFPSVFLGLAVAVVAAGLFTSVPVGIVAASGIAATAAAMLKLPLTSALLAVLVLGTAGAQIAPYAIFGAVIGLIARIALDKATASRAPAPSTG